MDKLLSKIASFGIPAIWIVVNMAVAKATGCSGATVITKALKATGPLGMKGGLVTLGITGLVADAFAEFGIECTAKTVIKEVLKTKDAESVKNNIEKSRWISKELKLKIIDYIDDLEENNDKASTIGS